MSTDNAPNEPPKSIHAERAVLGHLLLDSQRMREVAGRLETKDFYHRPHRRIYEAMQNLWRDGGTFDATGVISRLEETDNLKAAEGAKAVTRLLKDPAANRDILAHANTVIDKRRWREMLSHLQDWKRKAGKPDTPLVELVDEIRDGARSIIEDDERFEDIDPASLVVSPVELEGWLTGEEPEPRNALLERPNGAPFVVEGKAGMLVAAGGAGKSMLLTQMAVSVATGVPWLQNNVCRSGKVLLVMGEEDREEMQRRTRWAFDGAVSDVEAADEPPDQKPNRNELLDRVRSNLKAVPLYGKSARFMNTDARTGETEPTAFFRNLVDYLKKHGPWSLIIIDPAVRFMGAEAETNNAAAAEFISKLERLTKVNEDTGADFDATVIAAHHTSQKSRNPDAPVDQTAARGATALVDNCRWVAQIALKGPGKPDDKLPEGSDFYRNWRTLKVTKTNYTAGTTEVVLRYDLDAHRWVVVDSDKQKEREEYIEGRSSRNETRPSGM